MIPSRRLVLLAALLTVPLLLSSVNRTIADIGLLLNVVLAAAAMLDLLISPGPFSYTPLTLPTNTEVEHSGFCSTSEKKITQQLMKSEINY